ncbi:MAG: hypothetical protein ACK5U3_08380 [Pseudomonadota bacterium]|jgi:hypothetical protein
MSLHPYIAVSAVVLGMLATPAQGKSDTPQYGIKSDTPPTGSMIRREVVSGSRIPINRPYEKLTEAEREQVRSWYESMPATDEPPFPREGLMPILDALRKAQERLLVTGELFLIASVDSTGTVTRVRAIGSPSREMVKFAASVLLLTKFKPALCGGSPCAMEFPLSQRFQVE